MASSSSKDRKLKQEMGMLEIDEEVLSMITIKETTLIKGIVAIYGMDVKEITDILEKGKKPKGIKLEMGGGEVAMELPLVVEYGVNIPELAETIRARIKKAILEMTGYNVRSINIKIEGIDTTKKKKERNTETKKKTSKNKKK